MDLKQYLVECELALVRLGRKAETLAELRVSEVGRKEDRFAQLETVGLVLDIEEELGLLEKVERERLEYAAANRDFLSTGGNRSLAMKECEGLLWTEYMAHLRAGVGKVDVKQRDFGWPGWKCLHEDYLAMRGAGVSAVRELADLDVSIEASKRRLHLMMGRLRLAAATLNFLGGG